MTTVLQVVESFEGGVFTSVTQICNALAERGVTVHCVYSKREGMPRELRDYIDGRWRHHRLEMTREIHVWRDLRALLSLVQLYRSSA